MSFFEKAALVKQLVNGLARRIWRGVDFNLLCLHRKDVYLRKRGAQIGADCDLITDLVNFSSEPYLIHIGSRVTLTSGVKLITHDASTRLFRQRYPEMNARYGNLFGPIIIGDNCFVGVDAILLPNTIIGDNSIVGAGAVVKGRFPPNAVIVGVPARQVATLDDYIEKVRGKLVPLTAHTRDELRRELIDYFFGPQL